MSSDEEQQTASEGTPEPQNDVSVLHSSSTSTSDTHSDREAWDSVEIDPPLETDGEEVQDAQLGLRLEEQSQEDEQQKWCTWLAQQVQEGHESICAINVTSLWTNMHLLQAISNQIFILGETGIPWDKHGQAKGQAKNLGMNLILTGTDPEQAGHHAGVGIMVKDPAVVCKLRMATDEGEAAFQAGRMLLGAVHSAQGTDFNVIGLYGWTNSDHDAEHAYRTNELAKAARLEQAAANHTPTFIGGDLNASLHKLPAVQEALEQGAWIDVGAILHLKAEWKEKHEAAPASRAWPAPNCWAPGAKQPTRRSYLFCTPKALTMLNWTAVGPWGLFDVHACLVLGIKGPEPQTVWKSKKLAPLVPDDLDLGADEHTDNGTGVTMRMAATRDHTKRKEGQTACRRPG